MCCFNNTQNSYKCLYSNNTFSNICSFICVPNAVPSLTDDQKEGAFVEVSRTKLSTSLGKQMQLLLDNSKAGIKQITLIR